MCKNKKTVRTIRVVQNENRCVTMYSKGGIDKVVGAGKFGSTCDTVLRNIKMNLERAAWTCKETTAAVDQHYDIN